MRNRLLTMLGILLLIVVALGGAFLVAERHAIAPHKAMLCQDAAHCGS